MTDSLFQRLQRWVESFEGGTFEGPPEITDEEREQLRTVGLTLWRSRKHSQTIMLHAYAALFGIPNFIKEAHRRQPGRFSTDILFHAVQNTASNLWQAFYFDFDEHDRPIPRTIVPLTGVLKVLHGPQPIPDVPPRPRISDLVMAFFVSQIIRAVEHLALLQGIQDEKIFEHHYRHLARLVQRSGYRFPNDRYQADALASAVDTHLAGDDPECVACWRNLFRVADRLNITLSEEQIAAFLLPNERRYFEMAMSAKISSTACALMRRKG